VSWDAVIVDALAENAKLAQKERGVHVKLKAAIQATKKSTASKIMCAASTTTHGIALCTMANLAIEKMHPKCTKRRSMRNSDPSIVMYVKDPLQVAKLCTSPDNTNSQAKGGGGTLLPMS
jgi:hypothetical protein